MPRRLQYLFFGLSPLALLAGVLLYIHNVEAHRPADLQTNLGRSQAIETARSLLSTLGVDTGNWAVYCAAGENKDLFRYLQNQPRDERERALAIAAPVRVQVLFEARDSDASAAVTLSLGGQLLAYDIRRSGLTEAQPTTEEASLRLAQAAAAEDPRLDNLFRAARPEIKTEDRKGSLVTRIYTWRSPLQALRELEVNLTVAIRGTRIVSRSLGATVDPDFAARNLHGTDTLIQLFGMGYVLFAAIVAIYSLVSYGRRATQKEVSHSRTLWIALLVSLFFIGFIYTSLDETVLASASASTANARSIIGFIIALVGSMVVGAGLLVGIAYGSGEGDVREAYPGKLTSLDALIVGKIFSWNVGKSIVTGAVFGSWFLLASQLLEAGFSGSSTSESLNATHFAFMKLPWLAMLIAQPALSILWVVIGLLQPLAFVTRYFRSKRTRIGLLVLFACLAASGALSARPSIAGVISSVVIGVPALLIPFFVYDLLTALSCTITVNFVGSLVGIEGTYPGSQVFIGSMAALAIATVLIELLAWWKGRVWTEEEVRPEYAGHIAERQSLEEEVLAAREAQLRLLPLSTPEIAGLSIFASCLPAKVVGGDFYDFFSLRDGRLGIFIAEGGNRGLASALMIALAKGFLMFTATRPYSPAEIILKLEATLGSLLEGSIVTTTLAYAVIDRDRGRLTYARTGAYPKILVTRRRGPVSHREWEVSIPDSDRKNPIWEGEATLLEGDTVVMYTDGVGRRVEEHRIRKLAEEQPDAQSLHTTLLASLGAHSATERDDDLTSIVIGCTQTGVGALEGVA